MEATAAPTTKRQAMKIRKATTSGTVLAPSCGNDLCVSADCAPCYDAWADANYGDTPHTDAKRHSLRDPKTGRFISARQFIAAWDKITPQNHGTNVCDCCGKELHIKKFPTVWVDGYVWRWSVCRTCRDDASLGDARLGGRVLMTYQDTGVALSVQAQRSLVAA